MVSCLWSGRQRYGNDGRHQLICLASAFLLIHFLGHFSGYVLGVSALEDAVNGPVPESFIRHELTRYFQIHLFITVLDDGEEVVALLVETHRAWGGAYLSSVGIHGCADGVGADRNLLLGRTACRQADCYYYHKYGKANLFHDWLLYKLKHPRIWRPGVFFTSFQGRRNRVLAARPGAVVDYKGRTAGRKGHLNDRGTDEWRAAFKAG